MRIYNSLLSIGVMLLIFNGCLSTKRVNGIYCAEVERYNPKLGKQSRYKLTVENIESKIVQINYPNGGHSDSGDFDPPKVMNKQVSFLDYNGVHLKVDVLIKGINCFSNVNRVLQCTGQTKRRIRCKNKTDSLSQKCYIHG